MPETEERIYIKNGIVELTSNKLAIDFVGDYIYTIAIDGLYIGEGQLK